MRRSTSTLSYAGRVAGYVAVAAVIAWGGVSRAQAPGELLAAMVTWTSSSGQTGTVLFQGRVSGSALTGQVYAGSDTLVATGTMDGSGNLSGSLTTTDGTAVGTFSGTRDTAVNVQGAYATSEVTGGTFSAPADQLPSP
jgi:hypothetical protein